MLPCFSAPWGHIKMREGKRTQPESFQTILIEKQKLGAIAIPHLLGNLFTTPQYSIKGYGLRSFEIPLLDIAEPGEKVF